MVIDQLHGCVHCDKSSMLCFGCGCELSSRPKERRDLLNPSSNKVVTQWRELMMQNDYSENELDCLLKGGGERDTSGKMCRKCFTSYSHAVTLLSMIKSNLSKFIDAAVEDEPTTTKFPCLSDTPNTPTTCVCSLAMQSSSTASSPSVYVSINILLLLTCSYCTL